jgi:hypothetical protein
MNFNEKEGDRGEGEGGRREAEEALAFIMAHCISEGTGTNFKG